MWCISKRGRAGLCTARLLVSGNRLLPGETLRAQLVMMSFIGHHVPPPVSAPLVLVAGYRAARCAASTDYPSAGGAQESVRQAGRPMTAGHSSPSRSSPSVGDVPDSACGCPAAVRKRLPQSGVFRARPPHRPRTLNHVVSVPLQFHLAGSFREHRRALSPQSSVPDLGPLRRCRSR